MAGGFTEHSLGLDRMTALQREDFEELMHRKALWLLGQWERETAALLSGVGVDEARPVNIDIETLARSEDDEGRAIAASFIAEYAEAEPLKAFPLWAALVVDDHPEVARCARIALVSALGRRSLDGAGVGMVAEAWFAPTRAGLPHQEKE